MGEPKTEHPILFSAPMVRAILAGTKTQTRRVIPDATGQFWDHRGWSPRQIDADRIEWTSGDDVGGVQAHVMKKHCPYGAEGHTLWVKETHAIEDARDLGLGASHVIFRATATDDEIALVRRWRPSIFMPRWASRITPPVLSVRVERLQSITEEDARAEGADCVALRCEDVPSYRCGFAALWDSINGKRPGCSWAANPYVWVVGFGPAEVRS